MKRILFIFAFASVLWSCKTTSSAVKSTSKQEIAVNINLTEVKEDKVMVTVWAPKIKTEEVSYSLPKMVPEPIL